MDEAVFKGDFYNIDDVTNEFELREDYFEDLQYEVLYAEYKFAGGYDGSAFVLFRSNGKLYEVNGDHCSCFGLEGQWEPEETSVEALLMRPNLDADLRYLLEGM
jgi:hypothetical protein